jgi:hypothetical protein
VTPIATWWPRKVPPSRSHISSLRDVDHLPSTSICGVTNGCDPVDTFFTNTTGGLIVMAFKLYREGNKEPLIRRIAFNALLENALLE